VTWFFEEFLLRKFARFYRPFDQRFAYLFNSYYVSAGPRHARPQRGLITRPDGAEVTAYRAHVDRAVAALIESTNDLASLAPIVAIGLHHEQQHQELILTDILHAFSLNAVNPSYDALWQWPRRESESAGADALIGGIHRIGHEGQGFCFDNERPAHDVLLAPVRLARALVTNRQWLEFMADGGYTTPTLWLSDGFAAAEAHGWRAPGYWRDIDGAWFTMTLGGLRPVEPSEPVCHVSYYEADAFARWAGKDLPTEAEWEVAAQTDGALEDAFGLLWQWTRSAYAPYPGYRAAYDALGEYNGKFMINQMVLRGSSFATPAGHARPTYRNFFYPLARWQFTGLRLAEYEG
jgi:ergothioneine biosynthesis protein EgtB